MQLAEKPRGGPTRPWPGAPARRAGDSSRFLFFSNESVGLGHLRRSLTLAKGVTQAEPGSSALVVTGSPAASSYGLPPRVDSLKLPALAKGIDGQFRPQRLAMEVRHVSRVRSRLSLGVAEEFDPRVAVVDKAPLGLLGELVPMLEHLRFRSCRLVLGLRDIEDSPENVRLRWRRTRIREAIERYYRAILVYGPTSTPDAIDCMGWKDLEVPVHHVGYLGGPPAETLAPDLPPDYLLATVGGGIDGYVVLAALARALRLRPIRMHTVFVAGPLMPGDDVRRLRALVAGLDAQVWDSREDVDSLVRGASAVVSMAGYNTVAEVMRARKRALLVPRSRPSEEQLVRARRLAERGLQDMLHPDELSAETLRTALDRLLARRFLPALSHGYDGGTRATEVLTALAGDETAARAAGSSGRDRRRPLAEPAEIPV